MEAEIPELDLATEFVSLEEIEADYTAYRLAVDDTVDPKEPLGYMVRAPFKSVEDEPIPEMLWDKYLVEPFLRKGVMPSQRWTPEGSRCFYSALERETAIAEVAHYLRKRLADLGARPATAHYLKFSIEFHGKIVDVHALTSKHPNSYMINIIQIVDWWDGRLCSAAATEYWRHRCAARAANAWPFLSGKR